MRSTPFRSVRCQRAGFLFFMAVILAMFTASAFAQGGPGVDNSKGLPDNSIEGKIFFSGPAPGTPIKLQLTGDRGVQSANTDRDGRFFFKWLEPGRYTLTVDGGPNYESVSQFVEVRPIATPSMQGDRASQTATINIRLLPKGSGGPGSVVNANFANVPKPALDAYNAALKAAQENDRKKAIEFLKTAVSLHPTFVEALNGLGVQYMKTGDLDKAAEAFSSALKIQPGLFILHLNYGAVLLQQKKNAEAQTQLALAVKAGDTSATAHFLHARALIALQRYDEAEKEFQRVVVLGGDDAAMAHRYLGGIYVEKGDKPRAISELEAYVKLMPQAKDADRVRDLIKQLRSGE